MDFEWDPLKAEANLRKHRVAFHRAIFVFDDPARHERPDASDDFGEERWIALGFVEPYVLFVVFTHRQEKIRLISARKATRDEQQFYWNGHISL